MNGLFSSAKQMFCEDQFSAEEVLGTVIESVSYLEDSIDSEYISGALSYLYNNITEKDVCANPVEIYAKCAPKMYYGVRKLNFEKTVNKELFCAEDYQKYTDCISELIKPCVNRIVYGHDFYEKEALKYMGAAW